jgi:DNA-directed RNA polymerase specialized sigma24 family protein
MAITQRYADYLDYQMVGKWLDHWHTIFGRADKYLGWVELKVDVELAVSTLRPTLRDVFELYCAQGYAVNEIARLQGWKIKTVLNRYYELRCEVCNILSNQDFNIPPVSKCTYRTDSYSCDGNTPVGEKCL